MVNVMIELTRIKTRLAMFGYQLVDSDIPFVEFEKEKTLNYIVSVCNFSGVEEIPVVLNNRMIDKICSDFLYLKKNNGQLEGFNYDTVIKSIREGDTQWTLNSDSVNAETRFDDFISYLTKDFHKNISPYRKIKW